VLKKRWPERVLLLYAPVESEHSLAQVPQLEKCDRVFSVG
jgi:hypothetical protein